MSHRPGLRHGPAPERRLAPDADRRGALDRHVARVIDAFLAPRRERDRARGSRAIAARVAELDALSVPERRARLARLRFGLGCGKRDVHASREALAHAVEAAGRTLGLVARDGQRVAAEALLKGHFVEMPTGEGKTLAIALAAAAAALGGTPVHVLTANDYLAERDATRLAPLYAALGLSSACVVSSMDESARRTAYAADVVHVTGKQIGFDWMRDAVAGGPRAHALAARLGELTRSSIGSDQVGEDRADIGVRPPLLRGLCFAIVDEADSLLVDEARTPLVLAVPRASGARAERECVVALALARMLDEDADYRLSRERRVAELTEQGRAALGRLAECVDGVWQVSRYRDECVRQALAALHLWHRDRDYVVREGAVELLDEHSGRTLPDRRLQNGLHRLIELKERCAPTSDNEVIASIACQQLFRRYLGLAGTSGTLAEVSRELAEVYRVRIVRVPPACGSRRRTLPACVLPDRAAQFERLLDELEHCRSSARPVLIGTRSVEQSRDVSALLTTHRIAHRVLDASQSEEEAAIVAEAGLAGRVTVATNMAGRGTDIPLGPDVAGQGGLHIVSLAFNDARRTDRQLAGRAARQGDPGSFRQLWCIDDVALRDVVPHRVMALARRLLRRGRCEPLAQPLALVLVRFAQRRLERRHARQRRDTLLASQRLARHVAIGGNADHPA